NMNKASEKEAGLPGSSSVHPTARATTKACRIMATRLLRAQVLASWTLSFRNRGGVGCVGERRTAIIKAPKTTIPAHTNGRMVISVSGHRFSNASQVPSEMDETPVRLIAPSNRPGNNWARVAISQSHDVKYRYANMAIKGNKAAATVCQGKCRSPAATRASRWV